MSFLEPMMIPTSGCSVSISSISSSSSANTCSLVCGSEISLIIGGSSSLAGLTSLAGGPGHRSGGDVGAELHPVEGDPTGRIVRAIAGLGRVGAEPGHVEHASTGGDDLAVALGRAGVGHLGDRRRLLEAVDHLALRGALGVAGRGE